MFIANCCFGFLFLFNSMAASGGVYYISHGSIADHADAAIPGSIANIMSIRGENNTYVLTTSNTYYNLQETLEIPAGATLRGNSNWNIKLSAGASLDSGTMIKLNDGTTLRNLYINGNYEAQTVVRCSRMSDVTIKDCTIFKSKNDAMNNDAYTILLLASSTTNLVVEDCLLRRAGCDPKVSPDSWTGKGYAILLWNSHKAVIRNNDMALTTTGGIDITGSGEVNILNNRIAYTGLNRDWGHTNHFADNITGYHNQSSHDEDFLIQGNLLQYSRNHGIHVSGRMITVVSNVVEEPYLSGVMIHDQRVPSEFSEIISVKDNWIGRPVVLSEIPGNSNREVYLQYINDQCSLDYRTNQTLNGSALPDTATHYHYPTVFGSH